MEFSLVVDGYQIGIESGPGCVEIATCDPELNYVSFHVSPAMARMIAQAFTVAADEAEGKA